MIFFDVDDTLLDYKSSQDAAACAFANKYAACLECDESFPAIWADISNRHMARYLSGELSFQQQRRLRIQDALGIALSPQEADEIFAEYYQFYEASWRLFPDVKNALQQLAGFRLGVITNGDRNHQIDKLEKLGILSLFETVITPACAGAPKPELAIFEFAASCAKKSANQCWYLGDNYKADFCAAREAGFRSVWLNRNGHAQLCDSQCADLLDFVLHVEANL